MSLDEISIVHFIPGRVRLKVRGLRKNPDLGSRLESQLADIPGVLKMEFNPQTEAVLINYDRTVVSDPAHVEEVIARLRCILPDVDEFTLRRWLA